MATMQASTSGGTVSLTEPRTGRRFKGTAIPNDYGWTVMLGRMPFLLSDEEVKKFKMEVDCEEGH